MAIHTVRPAEDRCASTRAAAFTVGPRAPPRILGPLCTADPRPIPLTITGREPVLGRVRRERFPFSLEIERVERALDRFRKHLQRTESRSGRRRSPKILRDRKQRTWPKRIGRVSIAKGFDVREDRSSSRRRRRPARLLPRAAARDEDDRLSPVRGRALAYGMGLAERDLGWRSRCGRLRSGRRRERPRSLVLRARGKGARPLGDRARRSSARSSSATPAQRPRSAVAWSSDHGDSDEFEGRHRRQFGYVRSGQCRRDGDRRIEPARVDPESARIRRSTSIRAVTSRRHDPTARNRNCRRWRPSNSVRSTAWSEDQATRIRGSEPGVAELDLALDPAPDRRAPRGPWPRARRTRIEALPDVFPERKAARMPSPSQVTSAEPFP